MERIRVRFGRNTSAVTRILAVDTIDEDTRALLRARLRANALCILSEKPA